MYFIHKKSKISLRETMLPDDCFAEKAKNWLWILGIIMIGVVIFAIIKFPGSQNVIDSSTVQSVRQYAQAQNVAFNPLRDVVIKELAMKAGKLTEKRGVVIHSVFGGGRAQKAGLHVGDIIFRFNGHRVKNLKQFQSLVAQARPESDVKILVIRNGKKIKSIIRVGEGEMVPNQAQGAPAAWIPLKQYYRR